MLIRARSSAIPAPEQAPTVIPKPFQMFGLLLTGQLGTQKALDASSHFIYLSAQHWNELLKGSNLIN